MSKMEEYYVSGNAVRKLEAQPIRKEKPDVQQQEEQQKKRKRQIAAKRNRERALHMSRGYVAFLTVCVGIVAVASVALIQIQAEVTKRMEAIAVLESQIADLKADNDARYKDIMTSVDLDYIKDVAMNQLGMQYASQEQIIYYSVENDNFMDQYSDIPE